MKMLSLLAALCLAVPNAHADEPIIPENATLQTVSTGDYKFTEGPSLAPDGSIYFSDIPNNSIHRYDPATGETTLFTDDSGGANGLAFSHGSLYACSGVAREVRIYYGTVLYAGAEPGPDRWFGIDPQRMVVLTREMKGQRLNSPNDLAISRANFVYFTDPRYGSRDGMQMDAEAVYVTSQVTPPQEGIEPEPTANHFKPADLKPVIENLARPNGIGISPDEKTLYVNDHGDKKVWAYEVLDFGKPHQLGEARLLNDLADLGGPDGMTVGPQGRVYTTIYGKGVLILSPEGERLGFLETGPQTTNCTFGADGKTLYVTAEKSLKSVVLNTGVE